MLVKRMVQSLLIINLIALVIPDARAVWINGVWVSKGVQCKGEATVKNIYQNMVSISCSAEVTANPNNPEGDNGILICQNPGGNISIGNAFVHPGFFKTALFVPHTSDKKGKTTFSAILESGVLAPQSTYCKDGDIYCNCDNDPTGVCQALREQCPNPNWVPIDFTPIWITGTVRTDFCDNKEDHSCPCDPSITDAGFPYACASATGVNNDPWTFVWGSATYPPWWDEDPIPWAIEMSECELPNPETLRFGEQREYDCTVILDEGR
jgi:hypothetical protein